MGIAVIAPACSLRGSYRPGAVFFGGFFDFAGNGVQRFIPANLLPFAFALFSRPFIGIDNAVRVIDMLDAGKTFGAHRAPGGGIRVAFDMGNYAIGHFNQDAAAAVAAFTGSFYYLSFQPSDQLPSIHLDTAVLISRNFG